VGRDGDDGALQGYAQVLLRGELQVFVVVYICFSSAAAAAAPEVDPIGLIGVGHRGPTARAGPLRPSFVIGNTIHFRFCRPHPYGRGKENQCR
jgi:hypothetical protein